MVNSGIGLVSFVLNLSDGQVKFFVKLKLQRNCEINSAHQKICGAGWNEVWVNKC